MSSSTTETSSAITTETTTTATPRRDISVTPHNVIALGPYSVFNNWRVPDRTNLPFAGGDTSNGTTTGHNKKPINRKWLEELLQKYPNPTTPVDLQTKALVVAPMVDQSDLPFRLQCRKYGSNLCVTPMIHCRLFQTNEKYRSKFVCDHLPNADRPLIAQLCGPDPAMVLKTAQAVAPFVDGIDLNCGCPQGIAKRGLYGAYLLEEPELLLSIVRTLVHHLPNTPISVKVRLLPPPMYTLQDSLKLYQDLVDCGISMLTVHGRTRLHTNFQTGPADWSAIRQVVDLVGPTIPILANGNIGSLKDVRECLEATGVDGVMSSEAILEYPPLFCDETFHTLEAGYEGEGPRQRSGPGRIALAREYLALAKEYPSDDGGQASGIKCMRMHVHKFIHPDLQRYPTFRMQCVNAEQMSELEDCLNSLEKIHASEEHDASQEGLAWYRRHRDRELPAQQTKEGVAYNELADDAADCMAGLFGGDDDE
jgi:tRNA-dihydrouridine synthase 1